MGQLGQLSSLEHLEGVSNIKFSDIVKCSHIGTRIGKLLLVQSKNSECTLIGTRIVSVLLLEHE